MNNQQQPKQYGQPSQEISTTMHDLAVRIEHLFPRGCRDLALEIILFIVTAAKSGWTPRDLRHALSSDIADFLWLAQPLILDIEQDPEANQTTSQASQAIHPDWTHPIPPQTPTSVHQHRLLTLLGKLSKLSVLADTSLLHNENDKQHLTPEQRKYSEKVQSLLAKAESTQYPHEAEALIAKAQQLRNQYQLSQVQVRKDAQGGAGGSQCSNVVFERMYLHAPWVKHQLNLLGAVADANYCRVLLLHSSGIVSICGVPDDVAHVRDVFSSVHRQCTHFMNTSDGAAEARRNGTTAAYRRSFMLAYADRISQLLQSVQLDSEAALVLFNAVDETFDSVFHSEHLRSMSLSSTDISGAIDGDAAARKSFLGGTSRSLTHHAA